MPHKSISFKLTRRQFELVWEDLNLSWSTLADSWGCAPTGPFVSGEWGVLEAVYC